MNVEEIKGPAAAESLHPGFSPESSWSIFAAWQVFWLAFRLITFPCEVVAHSG